MMGRLSELAPDEAAHHRGTSADEAVQLQRALDRQREAIAARVEWLGYADLAAMIRADGRKG